MMQRTTFYVLVAGSLLISFAIALNLWEPLRGDYGWRWPYEAPDQIKERLLPVLALAIYSTGAVWMLNRPTGQIKAWAFLGSVLLPYILLTRWGDPLYLQFTRTASGLTSGPHLIAAEYTPDTIVENLKNWTAEQQRFAEDAVSIHAALAPPGLPLIYFGVNQVLEQVPALADPVGMTFRPMQCQNLRMMSASNAELSSALIGMLAPLWAALAIFPLFALTRRIADEQTASRVILLWALLPGLSVFTPVPNTFFPTLALIIVLLLWEALSQRRYSFAFAAGLLMFIATFLNISLVPLALFCGVLALGYHLLMARFSENPPPGWWSLAMGAAFGAGLGIGWLLLMLWGIPSPLAMLQTAMNQHLELERDYLPWLVLHLWDYGLFIGLPVFTLMIWGVFRAILQFKPNQPIAPLDLFALSIGITLLMLDISGTARGETGRVWQFFFPFSLITAVAVLRHFPAAYPKMLIVAQTLSAAVILLFLAAIGSGLADPPQEPPVVTDPQIRVDTNYLFGEGLRLTGFGGSVNADNNLVVDLRWQADQWQAQPYWFAILTVAPDGSLVGESTVYQPFEDAYPATCWQPGQTVIERVTIPLQGDPPPGDYWLSVSVHDYQNYNKLSVIAPDGTVGDQAGIGPILKN